MKMEVIGDPLLVAKATAMLKARKAVGQVGDPCGIPVAFSGGCPTKLSPEQDAELKSIVTQKAPAEVGLSGGRWSGSMVQLLIQYRYGVKVSLDWVYDMRARFDMPKDTRLGRPTKLISDMRDIAQQMKEVL